MNQVEYYQKAIVEAWPVPKGLLRVPATTMPDEKVEQDTSPSSLPRLAGLLHALDEKRRSREARVGEFPTYEQLIQWEEISSAQTHISIDAIYKLAKPDSALNAMGAAIDVAQTLKFYWVHCETPPPDLVNRAASEVCLKALTYDNKHLIYRDLSALVQVDQLWCEYRQVVTGMIRGIWAEQITTPPDEPTYCLEAEIAIWGWRLNARGNFESGITWGLLEKEDGSWRLAQVRSADSMLILDQHLDPENYVGAPKGALVEGVTTEEVLQNIIVDDTEGGEERG